jgi:hypothetical protein
MLTVYSFVVLSRYLDSRIESLLDPSYPSSFLLENF